MNVLAPVIAALFLSVAAAPADIDSIPVEGIENRGIYGDPVRLRVPVEPGFTYDCRLDGQAIPAGDWIEVGDYNYHELRVRRTRLADGEIAEELRAFVVYFKWRGTAEVGLPIWTPPPVIPSAPEELSGCALRLVAPAVIPAGHDLPVIALLEHAGGRGARLNGEVRITAPARQTLVVRRGFGSAQVAAAALAGSQAPAALTLSAQLHSLGAQKTIQIESATQWIDLEGAVEGDEVYPSQSRLHVIGALDIPRDASLSVGAGSMIALDPLANITVSGRLAVSGTMDEPVVFLPAVRGQPWGGFIAQTNTARIEIAGAILTGGGGDPAYFQTHFGLSHRQEQAVFVIHHGARVSLADSFLIDNPGQAGNGYGGYLTLDHCLIQRCITTGEYSNGGGVTVRRSALIEFPVDSDQYIDYDNDALYLTEGVHEIRDSILGWAKDDGLDAGSGYAGSVLVSNCWFEACFHEGMAWSGGGRVAEVYDTVVLGCGQAIEAGWSHGTNSPLVHAERLLCANNSVGARFGDNYAFEFNGFLRVVDSYLLFNDRDVWGMNWNDWTYRALQMDIRGNYLGAPSPFHPDNEAWDPAADGFRLAPFLPHPAGAAVGVGLAVRQRQQRLEEAPDAIPIALSSFTAQPVSVGYRASAPHGELARGLAAFEPGRTIRRMALPAWPAGADAIQIALVDPVGASITGCPSVYYVRESAADQPRVHLFRAADGLDAVWSDPACALESAPAAGGPWEAVPGAASPHRLARDQDVRFYRLLK